MEEHNPETREAPPGEVAGEELKAELLAVPEAPEPPKPVEPLTVEQVLSHALRYVRGKRGGDLLAVILVGSAARRSMTEHSDLDLIAVITGQDEGQEVIRVADRLIEVRYRWQKAVEEELQYVPRLPPLLRKGRVLFEHEGVGMRLLDKAQQRFRQGPPPVKLNEKIRLRADCLHWLGKAEDLIQRPATAQYLLGHFLEELLQTYFHLRGFWLTSPAEMLPFLTARDAKLGEMLDRFMTAPSVPDKLAIGHQLADYVFRDIPSPQRID
ncbi:MAG: hypothetical protein ACE5NA_01465 [Nitrospiraceae bacterium]